jgi:hypothetical protein
LVSVTERHEEKVHSIFLASCHAFVKKLLDYQCTA